MPEAIDGFTAIGMPEVSTVVIAASKQLGEPFPFDIETRRLIVGEPFEGKRMKFGDLENQFYELADTDRLFFRRLPKFVPFADQYAATEA
jgi:hypothetical protein